MFEVKASVNGYEVVSSGEIHAVNSPVDFVVAGLKLRIAFEEDEGANARYESEQSGDVFILKLYNFKNSLGEGALSPIPFATTNGRDIAITFFVHTIPSPAGIARRFSYNFLLGPQNG
jgi:hypothetical protein